jgi:glycosyltransferase involved in cell wall biosynthesis
MPFFPIFSAWVICALRRRKLYATWHEALSHKEWIKYMGMKGVIAAFIEHLCTRLPHRITAASTHTKELLATVHGRVKGVGVVTSGIDKSLLESAPLAQLRCDVLYVGRLVKDKHVEKLISAMGVVHRVHPDMHCVIIGQGVERHRLEEKVHQSGLSAHITFLDPLPKATDVYAYMKTAKVFCSPSVREGFGIVSLEALGCGTPVITTNSPTNAARHLIHDGQNGSIVTPTTIALAEAIMHWTSVPHKPNMAGLIPSYDWHTLAQKQVEVYSL